jgi:hypothetical protein
MLFSFARPAGDAGTLKAKRARERIAPPDVGLRSLGLRRFRSSTSYEILARITQDGDSSQWRARFGHISRARILRRSREMGRARESLTVQFHKQVNILIMQPPHAIRRETTRTATFKTLKDNYYPLPRREFAQTVDLFCPTP